MEKGIKGLDSLMEELKTTNIPSIAKKGFSEYDFHSVDCEDGYCITGDCTCDC